MIVEAILNAIYKLLTTVFGVLPNIPDFDGFTDSLNIVLDTIFNNLSLLGVFVRPQTIHIIVPVFLAIYNFEHIYHFIMWIIRKLPFSIN